MHGIGTGFAPYLAICSIPIEALSSPYLMISLVAAMLVQRASRFGPADDEAGLREFLLGANQAGAVELHALTCGGEIVATFAGAAHAGRFSGMMLSYAAEDRWARYSPGELLVARVVAEKCRLEFTTFDLGIGVARYKASFCPVEVPLFDTILGMTAQGRLAAQLLRGALTIKRRIKQSPRLWAAFRRVAVFRRSGRFTARG